MVDEVLVIDDNEQNVYLLRVLLEQGGYRVTEANIGQDGVALSARNRPAMILLDCTLPDSDGLEVLVQMRQNPDLVDTPIVAVTAHAMPGDRERGLEAGCSGYFEKPIDPETFVPGSSNSHATGVRDTRLEPSADRRPSGDCPAIRAADRPLGFSARLTSGLSADSLQTASTVRTMSPDEPTATTKCGTVVMLGDPNAGKSTLLNALVGEQIAIVSPKPQTTWVPVLGIHTRGNCQTVFIDPPGVMVPTEPIHEAMLESVEEALAGAAAALHLVPLGSDVVPLKELLPSRRAPIVPTLVVRTKADISDLTGEPEQLVVSARSGLGVDQLRDWCEDKLPLAEFRYDPDDIGTQPLRFFATEFVREAAFGLLGQEMPYSVAVEVEEFREDSDPVYIRVTAYLERESQKGIFIGKNGATIKQIGMRARRRMEGLMGGRVYLDLWAKVKPKWRRDPNALRQFGYAAKPKKRKKT